jgi:RinA family phage transcriptional activator
MNPKVMRKNFKIIEGHLRNYKMYKAGIKNLQKQLDFIMPNITTSYELREGIVGSFTFKSDTENYAIDRVESKRALTLHEDISTFQIIVDSIDSAMPILDETEKKFVQLRYFENKTVEYTAQQLKISSSNMYYIRNSVRDKLAIGLKNIVSL